MAAEEAGFDFSVMSDHYFPWLEEQGHSPNAWAVLGAAAQATERLPLMTFVTCPTFRYHPAVVAQQAATVGVLSRGRFTLGLGAGENLNEHVVGAWPHVVQRHDMLVEAVEIIRSLLAGEPVSFSGEYFDVPEARLWDLPDEPVPIGIAVSGPHSARLAGRYADAMVAVEPKSELGDWFDAATAKTREEDVAELVPCGPDLDRHVRAVRAYLDAGFTHVALVQVGGDEQDEFLRFAERELLPALRAR